MFGFTWHIFGLPEDDPRRTYVEFTLEAPRRHAVTVVKSGFAQLPENAYRTAYDGNTQGWARSAASLPTTSMPQPDIEAIAEQVFVALARPSAPILAALASGGPATATDLAGSCRSLVRPSPSTWRCWPRRAW